MALDLAHDGQRDHREAEELAVALDQHFQRIDRHHALAHAAVFQTLGVAEDADGLGVDVALHPRLLDQSQAL